MTSWFRLLFACMFERLALHVVSDPVVNFLEQDFLFPQRIPYLLLLPLALGDVLQQPDRADSLP